MEFKFGDKVHSGETNLLIIQHGNENGVCWVARDENDTMWYRDDFKRGWVKKARKLK